MHLDLDEGAFSLSFYFLRLLTLTLFVTDLEHVLDNIWLPREL